MEFEKFWINFKCSGFLKPGEELDPCDECEEVVAEKDGNKATHENLKVSHVFLKKL